MPVGHPYVFFEEMSIKIFCPFSNWVVCFFVVVVENCVSCLYILITDLISGSKSTVCLLAKLDDLKKFIHPGSCGIRPRRRIRNG